MQNLHNSILHHGDADSFLPTIPSGSIRLVLTDPPYNVSRKNNLKTMNRRGIDFGEWDKGFDQLAWLENAAQALMPSGSIVIWNDVKNLGFIGRHLEGLGFDVKTYLTFYKRNPIPRNMKRRFLQSTEHALWAVKKSRHKWVFNIREGESYENGVFTYPVQRDAHPNKKPNDMFVSLIKILSNENEWILDPFCGSGTTCYAAEVTKRKFVAIEKKLEYFEQAQLLWDEARSLSKM